MNAQAGATVRAAIVQSGILEELPQIDPATMTVGVFGRLRSLDDLVQAGERIEIYRPLQLDPKTARRQRARHKPAKN